MTSVYHLYRYSISRKNSVDVLKHLVFYFQMFAFFFVACLFEWLMYIAYMLYLLTFTPEFLSFRLVLEALPSSDVDRDVEIASNDKPGERDVTQSETTPSEVGNNAIKRETTDHDVTNEVTQSETKPSDVSNKVPTQSKTTDHDVTNTVTQSGTKSSVENSGSDENLSAETGTKSV